VTEDEARRMMTDPSWRDDPETARTAERVLEPGGGVRAAARAAEAIVLVTDRRLFVATGSRVALDVPFEGVRRIEFDVERDRAATLVIVPDHPRAEPQVLSISAPDIANASAAVAAIGQLLAEAVGQTSRTAGGAAGGG
jgi:hypothetical protein